MQKRHGAVGAALAGSFIIVACVAAFTTGSGKSPTVTPSSTASPTAPASPAASTPPGVSGYVASLVPPGTDQVEVAAAKGSSSLDDALATDLGDVMGVKWVTATVNGSADTVIQDVRSGNYQIGLSDLSENSGQQGKVDFLTYLNLPAKLGGPQGIAFTRKDPLEKATEAALAVLIADGEFQRIFALGHPAQATPVASTDPLSIIPASS